MKTEKISFRVSPEEAENLVATAQDLGISKSDLLRTLIFSKDLVGGSRKRKIRRNMAKCLLCGDVIESKNRHDFVECSCRNLFVDGGTSYLRRGCSNGEDSWMELSEYEED